MAVRRKPVANPRASQNQASAMRPGQTPVIRSDSVTSGRVTPQNTDPSRLRINARTAEQNSASQQAARARSLLSVDTERLKETTGRIASLQRQAEMNPSQAKDLNIQIEGLKKQQDLLRTGVGIPEAGYDSAGAGTAFDTLEDAEAAARDEYTRTGTISPGTDAALERFRNPGKYQDTNLRSRNDVRTDLFTRGYGSSTTYAGGTAGARQRFQDIRSQADMRRAEVTAKSSDPEFMAAEEQRHRDWLAKTGWIDSNAAVSSDDPYAAFRGASAKALFQRMLSGSRDAAEANEKVTRIVNAMKEFDSIRAGKYVSPEDQYDLEDLESEASQYESEYSESSTAENEKDLTRLGSQTETEGFVNEPPEDPMKKYSAGVNSVAQTTAIQSLLNALPPEYAFIGDAMMAQNTMLDEAYGDSEGIKDQRFSLADKTFSDNTAIISDARDRTDDLFSEAMKLAASVRDHKEEFIMDEKERQEKELKWQEGEMKRKAGKLKSEQVDSMVASLALSGGFGSSNGLQEIRDQETEWDQYILNAEKEFGFKRIEIANKFKSDYFDVNDKYALDIHNHTKDYASATDVIDQRSFASSKDRQDAKDKALADLQDNIFKSRLAKVDQIGKLSASVADAIRLEKEAQVRADMDFKKGNMYTDKEVQDQKLNFTKIIQDLPTMLDFVNAVNQKEKMLGIINRGVQPGEDPEQYNQAKKTAMIFLWNKLLDRNSVVRSEEFQRELEASGVSYKLGASGLREVKTIMGMVLDGRPANDIPIPDSVIRTFPQLADAIENVLGKEAAKESERYLNQIRYINERSAGGQIYPEDIFDKRLLPYLPLVDVSEYDAAESDIRSSDMNLGPDSSLVDFFSVYAPRGDNNNPDAYASDVAKRLRIPIDTPLHELRGRTNELAQAIAAHEGFINKTSGPAVRNNNPGNLKYIGQAGATLGEGGFAKFQTVEDGWGALRNDINAKISGRSRAGGRNVASQVPSPIPTPSGGSLAPVPSYFDPMLDLLGPEFQYLR